MHQQPLGLFATNLWFGAVENQSSTDTEFLMVTGNTLSIKYGGYTNFIDNSNHLYLIVPQEFIMPATKENVAYSTLSGTLLEMRSQLSKSKAAKAIVLTFGNENGETIRAIATMVESMEPIVGRLVRERQEGSIRSLIDALVPPVPPPQHMMLEGRMRAQAKTDVLKASEWLTSAQIAELAGFSNTNTSAQPNKWKKEGLIFAINHRGGDYFPDYGLDPDANYKPVKALADVIRVLKDGKDGWGMAFWFAAVNSYLGGKAPKDLLATAPDNVIAAAREEMSETAHG